MATEVDDEARDEAKDVAAFLPPIRRSWDRVAFIRDRPSTTSSNEVSVCDRAKLTCFVLWLNVKHIFDSLCLYFI